MVDQTVTQSLAAVHPAVTLTILLDVLDRVAGMGGEALGQLVLGALDIFCGDLNVAHREIDLKNPKTNRKNAGFTDEERAKFSALLDSGFTDTFRHFYPDAEGIYSWWSYRFKAREKNAGWRIDYFLTSKCLDPHLKDAKILTGITGSDHCPVELDFDPS